MFKFGYIKNKKFGWKYWVLMIDSFKSLLKYIEIRSNNLGEAYMEMGEVLREKDHFKKELSWLIYLLLQNKKDEPLFSNFMDDISYLGKKLFSNLIKSYLSGEIILVNKGLGYHFLTEDYELLSIVEKRNMVFPITGKENIRILQWSGGGHYYAKVGNLDVVVDGEQKWSNRREAEKAVLSFIGGNNE